MSNVAISDLPVATVINATDIIPFVQPAVAGTTKTITKTLLFTSPTMAGVSTLTGGAVIQGLTVGLGGGAVNTNTAIGKVALDSNITGYSNTASGSNALQYNTIGYENTANGVNALNSNTRGNSNTASGVNALILNTTASNNTAAGYQALILNTTGSNNTAVGYQALYASTPPVVTAGAFVIATSYTIVSVGSTNFVAIGASANTVGVVFTATGAGSGTGTASTNINALNTAIGFGAGSAITSGTKNTIIGAYSGNQGSLDIRTASNYIVLSDGDGNPRAIWNGANLTVAGNILVSSSSGKTGYTTGAGGTVTQATSISTNVTLDKPTGKITCVSNTFTSGTTYNFNVLNTLCNANSVYLITLDATSTTTNTDAYQIWATGGSSNSFGIYIRTNSTVTNTLVINFAVISGSVT